MPKIYPVAAPIQSGSAYPAPFDAMCQGRTRWRLGDAAGLTQFGVNMMRLAPGQWSSQRHWHSAEDEFVIVLEGEVVLVTEFGEELLTVGECAGFPAGDPDGHHLQNRSDQDALLLEVGSRLPDVDATYYPDIDLTWPAGGQAYERKDGTPYET